MLIGSHISLSSPDYLLNSLKETRKNGANCMMIYLGSPQNAKLIDDEKLKIEEYKVFASEINYNINNTIIHAPYIINLANKNNNEFSINFLNDEIKKMINIGSKILVLHPGNATNGISISEAIDNLSHIINSLIVPNDIKLCIETMSGKGTEIGKNFSEIKNIIEKIKNKDIIGVCLDTCHIWDSGYNLNNVDYILEEFDKIIGIKYLKIVHLNDSKNECGAKKDRHENIGYGKIGFDNLIKLAYHNKLINIPKILETPFYNNISPYKQEINMILEKKFTNWKKII